MLATAESKANRSRHDKLEHVPVSTRPLASIKPSPENDDIYGRIDPEDPEIVELAASIKEHGLREPIVISADGFTVSGHRRRVACKLAGLTHVPVRVEPIRRGDDLDRFVVLLREYNRQRDKSLDVITREEMVSANPEGAYQDLLEHREKRARVDVDQIHLRQWTPRCSISKAKLPFLEAVRRVIDDQREFLPINPRRIHYALLNDPPLIHAGKPASRYRNDLPSYKALVDLTARARLEHFIPMEAFDDETRPGTTWETWPNPRGFIREQLDDLLRDYSRDLQQSQPNHIEIIVEKNTVEPIVNSVAGRFGIPIISARGYASLPPRAKIRDRFVKSGKSKLILLIASDFDPDGEEIAHSLARSLRDDFGIQSIVPVKVALTAQQVAEFKLPPRLKAKRSSSRYQRFAESHGDDVFELEAIPPAKLQELFVEAIDSVMDLDAFNAEIDAEKADAAYLDGLRREVHQTLKTRTGTWSSSEGADQ